MQSSLLRQYFQCNGPLSSLIQNQPSQVLYKKGILKIFVNSQENTCDKVSILQASAHNFVKKKTLAQVFSWESCESFKNIFFTEQNITKYYFSLFCFKVKIKKKKHYKKEDFFKFSHFLMKYLYSHFTKTFDLQNKNQYCLKSFCHQQNQNRLKCVKFHFI